MKSELQGLVSESQILRAALAELTSRIPSEWEVDVQYETVSDRLRVDAVVMIKAPDGQSAEIYVEAKRSLLLKDLGSIISQLERAIAGEQSNRQMIARVPLVVARYLAAPVRESLVARKVSYADVTGNIQVQLERPALFLRDVGAQKDPWRGPGRPKGNLRGRSAARIVRALADFRPPYSVPDLMKLAGTPSGNTYRAVEFIEEQGLLTREQGGKITGVRWRDLLERWSRDSDFASMSGMTTCLAPRGLSGLINELADLRQSAGRFALTGSLAAAKWEPYAPTKSAMIYAERPDELVVLANLRRVDYGANVLIVPVNETAAFERTQVLDGVEIVAPSQAAVDLLTSPGRGPEEGRALLDWMEMNEDVWRR
jgi:hypothetical protein